MGAAFCLENAWTLQREAPLVLRYLLLGHSGRIERAGLDLLAERFGARPGFEVVKSQRPHQQFEIRRRPANPQPTTNDEP
jgi:hypothetical protein